MMSERSSELFQKLKLEQVVGTIPTALFLVDRNQRIVYWNPEAERITGFSAEEVIGENCSILDGILCASGCGLFDPEKPKPIRSKACSFKNRDGRPLTLLKNIDVIRDENGEILGGIESFSDISEQVRLEDQLRQQAAELEAQVRRRTSELEGEKTKLQAALDGMDDLAYITTADFRIEFMNRAMVEAFGDHRGRACYEIYGRTETCPWCVMPSLNAGKSVRQERFIEARGRTYEIMHTPLKEPDGTIAKLSVFRDITERKEAERNLRQAYRELDAFVHTVSHDLRTPLTPIIGYANFLQEEYGGQIDNRGMEILAEIESQGQRMFNLMEDLLALARVGHLDPPPAPVSTDPVVDQVLADLRDEIDQRGLRVEVEELPPVAVPETLLGELFSNLIGNAVRYGSTREGSIEIGGDRRNGRIRFYVRDHGPGIPPEEREKVFEIFHRGSTAAGSKGTGIGLATVRKIAEHYGGAVRCEETPGGGSTFWVEIASDTSRSS